MLFDANYNCVYYENMQDTTETSERFPNASTVLPSLAELKQVIKEKGLSSPEAVLLREQLDAQLLSVLHGVNLWVERQTQNRG